MFRETKFSKSETEGDVVQAKHVKYHCYGINVLEQNSKGYKER